MNLQETTAVITVDGVFYDQSSDPIQKHLVSFTRTFVLQTYNSVNYYIVNDMLHVKNANELKESSAFKVPVSKNDFSHIILNPVTNKIEESQMEDTLIKITGMKLTWAKK